MLRAKSNTKYSVCVNEITILQLQNGDKIKSQTEVNRSNELVSLSKKNK